MRNRFSFDMAGRAHVVVPIVIGLVFAAIFAMGQGIRAPDGGNLVIYDQNGNSFSFPSNTGTLLFSTLSTNALDAANSIWAVSNALNFEGTTADAFETSVTLTDPTADRTVTLPNANVNFSSPAPSDGFVLTFDSGTSTWQPEAASGGTAANPGYYMFPTSMPAGEEGNTVIASANQVRVIRYYLPYSATVDRIVFNVETAVGGSTCGVGIYNAAGTTLLVDGSGQSCASTGVKNVDVNVTLGPGFFLVAYTSSSATVAILTQDAVIDTWYDVFNATVVQSGTAANAATAGVLPATTGTLTAVSANSPVVKIQF